VHVHVAADQMDKTSFLGREFKIVKQSDVVMGHFVVVQQKVSERNQTRIRLDSARPCERNRCSELSMSCRVDRLLADAAVA
jgi:hypothetical protein